MEVVQLEMTLTDSERSEVVD